MTTHQPLPTRILIPVANPATAEELIRLGAAMLDERAGELSALGIVEVPEGMPLSEGATRARHARRLLQRVSGADCRLCLAANQRSFNCKD